MLVAYKPAMDGTTTLISPGECHRPVISVNCIEAEDDPKEEPFNVLAELQGCAGSTDAGTHRIIELGVFIATIVAVNCRDSGTLVADTENVTEAIRIGLIPVSNDVLTPFFVFKVIRKKPEPGVAIGV